MNRNYGANDQWQKIAAEHMPGRTLTDLAGFKSSSINYRISLNDAQANGVRYLKALTYNLAADLEQDDWDKIRAIKGREHGDPFSVTFNDEEVDLDYLRAILEVSFISKQLELDRARVMEIGAGYGRTCHTMFSLFDISEYWVIDLPETMRLSKGYLSTVLEPHHLERVTFVEVDDIDERIKGAGQFDICINIDSMAEMDRDVVQSYLSLIDERCAGLYVQNTVGKFKDKSLDGHPWGEEAVDMALRSGLLTDVIDIHDSRQIKEQAPKFVSAYRPGRRWRCLDDSWARPFTHHWQAVYARS
ncbi:putative sugar O-methyltransferase [Nocardiopsis halophila]|uniref:putative sugar O-methyltransferase n=1 Tax=Nocardiopsis halophila TaxID=141692 RepID=UPI0003637717|nr:putative sugar O-methyltransferase [Nocardiopsis halophila]